jgi:cytochrome c-type biogenesis protein CcmE
MTRKSKRLTLIVGALAMLGVAAGLNLFALFIDLFLQNLCCFEPKTEK